MIKLYFLGQEREKKRKITNDKPYILLHHATHQEEEDMAALLMTL
jgi:hypothetical protein